MLDIENTIRLAHTVYWLFPTLPNDTVHLNMEQGVYCKVQNQHRQGSIFRQESQSPSDVSACTLWHPQLTLQIH